MKTSEFNKTLTPFKKRIAELRKDLKNSFPMSLSLTDLQEDKLSDMLEHLLDAQEGSIY